MGGVFQQLLVYIAGRASASLQDADFVWCRRQSKRNTVCIVGRALLLGSFSLEKRMSQSVLQQAAAFS